MKLWEAFKALDEGKEVEYNYDVGKWKKFDNTIMFNNHMSKVHAFRITHKALECWVNVYEDGKKYALDTKGDAEYMHITTKGVVRVAVHMKEVAE